MEFQSRTIVQTVVTKGALRLATEIHQQYLTVVLLYIGSNVNRSLLPWQIPQCCWQYGVTSRNAAIPTYVV
jgi:hypothetical protein